MSYPSIVSERGKILLASTACKAEGTQMQQSLGIVIMHKAWWRLLLHLAQCSPTGSNFPRPPAEIFPSPSDPLT